MPKLVPVMDDYLMNASRLWRLVGRLPDGSWTVKTCTGEPTREEEVHESRLQWNDEHTSWRLV